MDLSKITTYQSGVYQATAYRVVKKHTAEALKEFNLTCMQWFTIGTVLDAGTKGITLTDLAKKLDTTLAYMTTTATLLESKKILTRTAHSTDGRTKLIAVNPSYIKTAKKIEITVRQRLRIVLYDQITPEELLGYIKVLGAISKLK